MKNLVIFSCILFTFQFNDAAQPQQKADHENNQKNTPSQSLKSSIVSVPLSTSADSALAPVVAAIAYVVPPINTLQDKKPILIPVEPVMQEFSMRDPIQCEALLKSFEEDASDDKAFYSQLDDSVDQKASIALASYAYEDIEDFVFDNQ